MIDQLPVPMILLVVGVLAFAAIARNMGRQHRPSFEATPDQKRDGFLKSAKIRCIRWQSRQKSSTAEIPATVLWREETA